MSPVACCAAAAIAAATPASAAPPPPPPLFELCFAGAAFAVDADLRADDDANVVASVHDVFVAPDVDGGVFFDVAPGEQILVAPCSIGVSESRHLLLTAGDGTCVRVFLVDERGRLEDAKPDDVTTAEAGAAFEGRDCAQALDAAGYDPPRPTEPLLETALGCRAVPASTSALAAAVLLVVGVRRRRSRPPR